MILQLLGSLTKCSPSVIIYFFHDEMSLVVTYAYGTDRNLMYSKLTIGTVTVTITKNSPCSWGCIKNCRGPIGLSHTISIALIIDSRYITMLLKVDCVFYI